MTDVTDAAAADLVTILTNARDAGYSPEMMLEVATRALAEAERRGMGRAKEAIAPFLSLAEHYLNRFDHDVRPMRDDRPVFTFDTSEITVADLRRLRAALAGGEGE